MRDILRGQGWLSSRFDADVEYRLNVKTDLYEYVGTHTDDLLIVGPPGTLDKILGELRRSFTVSPLWKAFINCTGIMQLTEVRRVGKLVTHV
jgi:hypothetical protein